MQLSMESDHRQTLKVPNAPETPTSGITPRFPFALKSPRTAISSTETADACYDVETLEKIFAEFSDTHITYVDYLDNREDDTYIPQLSVSSPFIENYDEEEHQHLLEVLESGYTQLCHEDKIG